MLKFNLDPLEFRNSGIYGIAGIGTWSANFCRKKACYICFPYISTMKNTNLMLKFNLDPLEFRDSRIHGIGTWSAIFCRKKACYICFPYILTMRNRNSMLKFSLGPLEFRNSGIHGIAGIWARAVLNTFLLCKNKKRCAQLNIFASYSYRVFFISWGKGKRQKLLIDILVRLISHNWVFTGRLSFAFPTPVTTMRSTTELEIMSTSSTAHQQWMFLSSSSLATRCLTTATASSITKRFFYICLR